MTRIHRAYGVSMYANSQADSIDDLMEDTIISVCNFIF